MALQIEPTTVQELQAHRREHFARLAQLPELYLELMVPAAGAHHLRLPEGRAGHALVTPDGTLLELCLTAAGCRKKEEIFLQLCQALRIRRVLCYSFDSTLVGLGVASGAVPHVHGVLWREYLPGPWSALPVLRLASERDIERIAPYRDSVFDTEEQVFQWVRAGWTYILEEGEELVGVGLCSPVWPGSPQRDVGVMVHPTRRGQGHGARIVASLAERCLRDGLVPTAGCAADNVASQRTLSRAGFVSRHSLIRFELGTVGRPADDPKLQEVARSLTGDARLLPFLPELLQDVWALGLGTEPTLHVLAQAGLDVRTGMRVLDLGCGKAEALVTLAEKLGWQGEGVDLMPAFIQEGLQRAADHRVSHLLELEVADLADAVANGGPVDIVLFGMDSPALGSLPDALRAVQRRLRPGGHVVLSTVWARPGRPKIEGVPSEAETREAARTAGLTVIAEEQSRPDWVRAQNRRITAQIRRRAEELSRRRPDEQRLFDDYVRGQEDECRQLEEDLVCSTLLLRMESRG